MYVQGLVGAVPTLGKVYDTVYNKPQSYGVGYVNNTFGSATGDVKSDGVGIEVFHMDISGITQQYATYGASMMITNLSFEATQVGTTTTQPGSLTFYISRNSYDYGFNTQSGFTLTTLPAADSVSFEYAAANCNILLTYDDYNGIGNTLYFGVVYNNSNVNSSYRIGPLTIAGIVKCYTTTPSVLIPSTN